MHLYAHSWLFKIKAIIANMQGKSESPEVRKKLQLSNVTTFESKSPKRTSTFQRYNIPTFQQMQLQLQQNNLVLNYNQSSR
jgi:hypothetical protein